jgi:hypothetical protein
MTREWDIDEWNAAVGVWLSLDLKMKTPNYEVAVHEIAWFEFKSNLSMARN